MVKELFINMTILVSFISIGSQLVKRYDLEEGNSIRINVTTGLISGTLGILLMLFSIRVTDNAIIDFRNIPIIMAAIYGGGIPVIISCTMIAAFRVVYFGVNTGSLLGVIVAIVNGSCCWYLARRKLRPWKRWTYATLCVLIVSSVALFILLRSKSNFIEIMLLYWSSYGIVSAITYWYVNYSLTANQVFRRLQKESTKDFLTDLNNVRQFDFILNSAIENAREKDENLSLLMIDIDFFKKVNDTYGHKEGDVVLKELGKILTDNCRTFDQVSRNGGEEFSVLLLDCPNEQAVRIAERIRASVEKHPFILSTGVQISITVSIGVASYPETIADLEVLVEKADTELYAAKRTGRNKVCSNQSCAVLQTVEA